MLTCCSGAFNCAASPAQPSAPAVLIVWPLPAALQARIQRDTNDAKNALEAYIYGLRNKL